MKMYLLKNNNYTKGNNFCYWVFVCGIVASLELNGDFVLSAVSKFYVCVDWLRIFETRFSHLARIREIEKCEVTLIDFFFIFFIFSAGVPRLYFCKQEMWPTDLVSVVNSKTTGVEILIRITFLNHICKKQSLIFMENKI